MKKIIAYIFSVLFILSVLPFSSTATEVDNTNTKISATGFDSNYYLTDNNHNSFSKSAGGAEITITNENALHHVYVIFDKPVSSWKIRSNDREETVGTNSFLHEYINVFEIFGDNTTSVTLSFEGEVAVSEVYGFTEGDLPDWVQVWQPPLEKADILLLSSHSDDEQLFFAGILPYYAGEVGADVQVVYLISHFDVHNRPHEQLDGLWAVGVRNYPIISDFPDLYSESLDGAISIFKNQGYDYSDFESYIAENIRRFKPQVLITHDINGEYSHGTHILCTDVVMKLLPLLSDEAQYPESAEKYGVWDVPKTYLHLYNENQIVMNWDIPLTAFDGKTAFEMSVIGFSYHKSQHWTWFNDWIHGTAAKPVTKATDIKSYSPCNYGLYRTTVGYDTIGGDFLENITLYKDQVIIEEDTTIPDETTNLPPETQLPESTENDTTINTDNNNNNSAPIILFALIFGAFAVIIIVYFMITKKK